MSTLDHAGPQLTSLLKGDWMGLYRCVTPLPSDPFSQIQAVVPPSDREELQIICSTPFRKFFKSPNFDGWYRHRHKEMSHKLESLHLEVICEAVSHWAVTGSAGFE